MSGLNLTALGKKNRIEELIENAWMNLTDEEIKDAGNPLDKRTDFDRQNPHIWLLQLMRKPEYLGFTCKHLFNIDLELFQICVLQTLFSKTFIIFIATRGGSKSYLLGLYSLLRATFNQGSKIVIVAAGFRSAKFVFEYAENIWQNAPVFQDLIGSTARDNRPRHDVDKYSFKIGESFVVALPLGLGDKIRGQRATHLVAEEFASVPPQIYENVVSGFSSVSKNPVQESRRRSKVRKMKELGLWNKDNEINELLFKRSNQQILSGTCSYEWNHFCKYWKDYKSVIESEGDHEKLKDSFDGKFDPNLNYKGFAIIRLPAPLLPEGFMDDENLARSRAMLHTSLYDMEFNCIFISDSDGFYRRSLIEKCVVGKSNAPIIIGDEEINFVAQLTGNPTSEYIFGVDSAAVADNFAIVVLEKRPTHRRIVFGWTINMKRHRERVKKGLADDEEFYTFCVKKIKSLMKAFPCIRIAIDSQGGGEAIKEGLGLLKNCLPGELPIYSVKDDKKPNPTDDLPGSHIIEMINFANADWVSFANHGMRKDFEDRILLFPHFDPVTIALAIEEDKANGKSGEYDTYEDCVMEIEELKDELATIVHTQTGVSGRDRWDVPGSKVALGIQKKGPLRKDRVSALLMANAVARSLDLALPPVEFNELGGVAGLPNKKEDTEGNMYATGPDWLKSADTSGYGLIGKPNFGRGLTGLGR